eukprot:snap_masked-scaffold_6-processed-gene-12.18-mRNA-1 protein AED:1.00 eAED:1.00 QI:0/0/0/0/1/1/2/0/101
MSNTAQATQENLTFQSKIYQDFLIQLKYHRLMILIIGYQAESSYKLQKKRLVATLIAGFAFMIVIRHKRKQYTNFSFISRFNIMADSDFLQIWTLKTPTKN